MNIARNKEALLNLLEDRLALLEMTKEEVNHEQSLFEQGILDSLSFLEFVVELEETFSVELDFSELDPTEFNSIDKLAKIIDEGN